MKKIKILVGALLIGSTMMMSSCSDDFLDTKPSSSVDESLVLSTADGLLAAVNGMHRNMYVRQN